MKKKRKKKEKEEKKYQDFEIALFSIRNIFMKIKYREDFAGILFYSILFCEDLKQTLENTIKRSYHHKKISAYGRGRKSEGIMIDRVRGGEVSRRK